MYDNVPISPKPADGRFLEEIAEALGIGVSTIKGYAYRPARGNPFPGPGGRSHRGPHISPWWYRADVDAWHAARPGPGAGGNRVVGAVRGDAARRGWATRRARVGG